MRLADVDALKQTFCAVCDHSIKCEDCDIDYHFEHLAPAIDAVEVVRCKDCKWYERRYPWNNASMECSYLEAPMDDNDYCSWGERREDGKTD